MITEVMVKEQEVDEPTKKERKEKILAEIRKSVHNIVVYQDRPYTFVSVKVIYKGYIAETFGFTKVNYPDRWSRKYGMELALEKALNKAARAFLVSKEPVSPIVENLEWHERQYT